MRTLIKQNAVFCETRDDLADYTRFRLGAPRARVAYAHFRGV